MSNFMQYAIQLAQMVDGQTGVNPPVGSVVVNDGRIVGIGAHLKQGDKHAEVQALDMAQEKAKGGTIYISLEPCTHYGSTPPCVNKIIEFGLSKVIYAVKDTTLPSEGDKILQDAGIEVEYQPSDEATMLYKDFFKAKESKIPEITLKVSTSLDGKQATDNGQSQWITNKYVKQDVYQLRHSHDAVLTGNGTVDADNPQYTTRIQDGKHPIRIVLSKSGDIDFSKQMFQDNFSDIWIYTENQSLSSPSEHINIINLTECKLANILADIYDRGVGKLLVEAGPRVTSEFLQTNYVNQLIIYYAPIIIGGSGQYQFFQTDEVIDLNEATQFEIISTELIHQNIKMTLRKK
ncbi:bifunctional diaminohydroxyphosphoribosylaminopyrimidine deaminase/5-amino-6-(5-phosphoribosylamino)uracil reductase RibD [Staphylococcus petrasii]|uniref:bifunctional diaminohydroxyphosphoribosylaminopyrimidine deaminase/5-amino-6-(5-phosphoribosylamino)uracil reductase RibD n=1 Tax=Staphylococcus petrasii TaxID=1276936 RepID=UPI000CD0F369|nr:bifunctional diaminohydroxyphosphoribosylaminopyrimidine deaminase/5-amino-6-(5-phosphoribosylamino)uracil reductase RibD [Staphylococcus petrasii]PNZ80955.1 bifunctional diaminohydroxyphosphoribosylaminopyrimidine deaminase/5-amino-6-(5-phosphoribosylamino)uracil reductase RibD [Staphylococcus petrasii]TGA83049.1 bifunctional diaminohydroxyphosphoribosylaminopyrimidine deaminase/5-amino-6-(5-phosphoribosylamino)uracil reductase RibD [Staphylococcus petrasii]SUM59749.1 riboflavin specific dea